MKEEASLASEQRSLGVGEPSYPLWPPRTTGCPESSTEEVQYPLEVTYEYDAVDTAVFEQPPLPGIERWAPLLPPLAACSLGEGGTPLVTDERLVADLPFDRLYLKDESQNPTWSHKDRLNRCCNGAAQAMDAQGIVVASSGNHGASAAAYAAATGLPCIVLTAPDDISDNIVRFLRSYGAAVLAVSREERWSVMRELVERLDYHPVSNLTRTHTGHPFGPEGYKTIAYEIYTQLGNQAPGTVFVPTGYGELLYGVWKGFRELHKLGVTETTPRMVACEPAARAPLSKAIAASKDATTVPAAPTEAYSIRVTVSGYRGVRAIEESNGYVCTVSDTDLLETRRQLAEKVGLWQETAGGAGLAGLYAAVEEGRDIPGPVVCLATSSGFKNRDDAHIDVPRTSASWSDVVTTLREEYGLDVQ